MGWSSGSTTTFERLSCAHATIRSCNGPMSCPKSSRQSRLPLASPLAFLLSIWRTVLKPFCLLTLPKLRICSLPLQSPLPQNPSLHTKPDSYKSASRIFLIWHFVSKKTKRPCGTVHPSASAHHQGLHFQERCPGPGQKHLRRDGAQ
jgi:hypothetical protein